MVPEILSATPDQAEILTKIAFTSKRHWGYPERWIQIWAPILTVSEEFIDKHDTFIAYAAGKPAGFYAISINNERASLEHFWVLPEFMGQGIGRTLFEHAINRCEELGINILEIESDPNAQDFYERMGAKKVGESVGEVEGQRRVLPVLVVKISR